MLILEYEMDRHRQLNKLLRYIRRQKGCAAICGISEKKVKRLIEEREEQLLMHVPEDYNFNL